MPKHSLFGVRCCNARRWSLLGDVGFLSLAGLQVLNHLDLGGGLGRDELDDLAGKAADEDVAPPGIVKVQGSGSRGGWLHYGDAGSREIHGKEVKVWIAQLAHPVNVVNQGIDAMFQDQVFAPDDHGAHHNNVCHPTSVFHEIVEHRPREIALAHA